jgi:hypothetical protein
MKPAVRIPFMLTWIVVVTGIRSGLRKKRTQEASLRMVDVKGLTRKLGGPTAAFEFIKGWCSSRRPHPALDMVSPIECESSHLGVRSMQARTCPLKRDNFIHTKERPRAKGKNRYDLSGALYSASVCCLRKFRRGFKGENERG